MLKLLLKSIVLVALVSCIVLLVGAYDNRQADTNDNIIRVKMAHEFDSLDYLFIGNSYVYSGINPVYFDSVDVRTYNLGVSTAGPYYYEMLIDDYIASVSRPPHAIVMVVAPVTFSPRADNWGLYPIHRYLHKPLSNIEAFLRYPVGNQLPDMIHKSFVKGASYLVHPRIVNTADEEQKIRKVKGFNKTVTAVKQRKDEEKVYREFARLEFDSKKLEYLQRIIKKYKEQHIEVILNEMPTLNVESCFSAGYMKKYNMAIAGIKAGGTRIISKGVQPDKSMFRNIDHLNYRGADVYTSYLREQLLHPKSNL